MKIVVSELLRGLMPEGHKYLQSIDWVSLSDAYGSAQDLPGDLIGLTSLDGEKRASAFESLASRLVHQGSRYQASSYAVPFLLMLVQDPSRSAVVEPLELLSLIAVGEDDSYLSGDFAPYRLREEVARKRQMSVIELRRVADEWISSAQSQRQRQYRESRMRDADLNADREAEQVELAAYDAVMSGVSIYGELLNAGNWVMRMWAAYLLGLFPERGDDVIPHLKEALEVESNSQVTATAAISSGLVGTPGDAQLELLLERRLNGHQRIERWGAAIGLEWMSHRSDPLVSRTLDECVRLGDRESVSVPFYDRNINIMAGLASDEKRRLRSIRSSPTS